MGPWVQMAVFCRETAAVGRDERWPVQIMTVARFGPIPALLPNQVPVFEFEVCLFMSLAADGTIGPRQLQATFSAPGGTEIAREMATIEFVGVGVAQWSWKIRGKVDEPGTYWAEIRIGERTMTRVPLEVEVL